MKPSRRASNMSRSLGCPASSVIVPLVPERPRDDGHFGVWAHYQIALRAIKELGAIPPEGGLPPPQIPAGYKPPSNSVWMVDWAIRHLRETIPSDWALMVEVEFEHEFERWILTGHADIVAQSPDGKRIKAKDWKMVFVPVDDAEENDQVLSYDVLMKMAWAETEEIEFEVCSPRLSAEERITSVTIKGQEIDDCVASLDARVCASLERLDELNPGIKQCKFCIGCACPAIREHLKTLTMKLTPEIIAKMKDAPTDAELGDFVVMARTLAAPIKDATEILHERLDTQGTIVSGDGTTITSKKQRGAYTIDKPVDFMRDARELLVTDERLAAVYSPSMTSLVEQVADALSLPKQGKVGVTAQSIVDGKFKAYVTQGEKRVLQFT